MQPKERFDSDRFPESLERQLRNLPKLAVPEDLEARLLAAIPADKLIAIPHIVRASSWRRTLMSSGVAAFAAACLMLVVLRPKFEDMFSMLRVAVLPGQSESDRKHLVERPDESLQIESGLQDPRLRMYVEPQPFTWPIHQKSPLMVSSKIPDDLFD